MAIERLRRRAGEYLAVGNAAAAGVVLESLLREAPGDPEAMLALARVRLHEDRYRDAHALAHAVATTDASLTPERVEALRAFASEARMLEVAEACADLGALDLEGLISVSASLEAIGAAAHARRFVDEAARRAPGDPRVRVNRALLAIDTGRFDEARVDLEAVCAGADLVPLAHWLLAQFPDEAHVARLRALLEDPRVDDEAEAALAFALHRGLDALDRVDQAWAALDRGLRARRRFSTHDAAREARLVDMARAVFPDAAPRAPGEPDGPVPVFVIGMHRSGTTLLERLLARHPAVAAGGESQRFVAQLCLAADHHCRVALDETLVQHARDFAAIGRGYVDASRYLLRDGRTHFTEKLPSHWLHVGFIRRALPHARILHVTRDPLDTTFSMLRELFPNGCPYPHEMTALGAHYRRYAALMAHWKQTENDAILDVRYEDLVRDPDRELARVFEYVGLRPSDSAAEEPVIRTASAVQARAPVHARSIGNAARYAKHLDPLRAALEK